MQTRKPKQPASLLVFGLPVSKPLKHPYLSDVFSRTIFNPT